MGLGVHWRRMGSHTPRLECHYSSCSYFRPSQEKSLFIVVLSLHLYKCYEWEEYRVIRVFQQFIIFVQIMNCFTLIIYFQIFISLLTNLTVNGQNWSKIPKWADFGFYGSLGFEDLDFKLEFILDNYEILSIEKCTGNGEGKTVSK